MALSSMLYKRNESVDAEQRGRERYNNVRAQRVQSCPSHVDRDDQRRKPTIIVGENYKGHWNTAANLVAAYANTKGDKTIIITGR